MKTSYRSYTKFVDIATGEILKKEQLKNYTIIKRIKYVREIKRYNEYRRFIGYIKQIEYTAECKYNGSQQLEIFGTGKQTTNRKGTNTGNTIPHGKNRR